MKPTRSKLRYWLKDELKAAREYRKYGFHSLAEDEERHARIMKELLKRK